MATKGENVKPNKRKSFNYFSSFDGNNLAVNNICHLNSALALKFSSPKRYGFQQWILAKGAFLKNRIRKYDYIGEYTSELISHREANKCEKIYDCENSSFLVDLNDQYVLDAYCKGNKLICKSLIKPQLLCKSDADCWRRQKSLVAIGCCCEEEDDDCRGKLGNLSKKCEVLLNAPSPNM